MQKIAQQTQKQPIAKRSKIANNRINNYSDTIPHIISKSNTLCNKTYQERFSITIHEYENKKGAPILGTPFKITHFNSKLFHTDSRH